VKSTGVLRKCVRRTLAALVATTGLMLLGCGGTHNQGGSVGLQLIPQIDLPLDAGEFQDFELSMALSESPGRAMVYRFTPQIVNEDYARSVAALFNIASEPIYDRQNQVYTFISNSVRLVVQSGDREDSGRISFNDDSVVPDGAGLLGLSDDDVRTSAEAFLANHHLLPADAAFMTTDRDRQGKWVDVIFGHAAFDKESLAWLPVRIEVRIVGVHSVASIYYVWPGIEMVGQYPIVSQQEAFQRLLQGEGSGPALEPDVGFSSVDLAYMTAGSVPWTSGAAYLVPVYHFRGASNQLAIVPALTDNCIQTTEYATPTSGDPCSP